MIRTFDHCTGISLGNVILLSENRGGLCKTWKHRFEANLKVCGLRGAEKLQMVEDFGLYCTLKKASEWSDPSYKLPQLRLNPRR